jgi:hypothetical protein
MSIYLEPISGGLNFHFIPAHWLILRYQIVVISKGNDSFSEDSESLRSWISVKTGGSYLLTIHQNYRQLEDLQVFKKYT